MTLYLLDPNLVHLNGHHYPWDLSIATAAASRNIDVVIIAHKDFVRSTSDQVKIVRHFQHTTYETLGGAGAGALLDDYQYYNNELMRDLERMDEIRFQREDIVLIPTCNQNHILGFIRWMKSFQTQRAPTFIIHLIFPHDLSFDDGTKTFTELLYRVAMVAASEEGPEIHFFGAGEEVSEGYRRILGQIVLPFPIPAIRISLHDSIPREMTILFAGDAKIEKGFLLLPEICNRICPAYPERDFLIHANLSEMSGEELSANERLKVAADKYSNLKLQNGWLGIDAYNDLLAQSDSIVLPYDAATYKSKTSGVLWEGIASGLVLVVPSSTWLAREAVRWEGGMRCFREYTAEGIAKSITEMLQNLHGHKVDSERAAALFGLCNGPPATVDQILAIWTANAQLRSLRRGQEIIAFDVVLHTSSRRIEYSHLSISLSGIVAGGLYRPPLRFKVCVDSGERVLEFESDDRWLERPTTRENPAPSHSKKVVRLGDYDADQILVEKLDSCDLLLLNIIVQLLPQAVEYLTNTYPELDRAFWLFQSATLASQLLNRLRKERVPAAVELFARLNGNQRL